MFATCSVGLIGDDIHAVCREMKDKLGINVFGFSCEGYKGVSQSAGHHIANNQIFKHVIGRDDTAKSLRKIAEYFGEPALLKRVNTVIADEMVAMDAARAEVAPRTRGKRAMLFVGGSRAHHYQELFRE